MYVTLNMYACIAVSVLRLREKKPCPKLELVLKEQQITITE